MSAIKPTTRFELPVERLGQSLIEIINKAKVATDKKEYENKQILLQQTNDNLKEELLMLQKEFKLCYNSFNRSNPATYLKAGCLNGV